jgi:hypothetical protein
MHATDTARFERRLYVFSFVRTIWFYLPVLVHHLVGELREAGAEQPHTVAMSTLVVFSIACWPIGQGESVPWRCRVF